MKRLIMILILATVLAIPGAAANHWVFYTNGIDNSPARTLEDDGDVMRMGGDELFGRGNRVVMPGDAPGDGTLFLDARVGTSVVGSSLYGDAVIESAFTRGDVLITGPREIAAWYGHWLDINSDHVIDDVAAGACAGPCASDEFQWRGLATGDSIAMNALVAPRGALVPVETNYRTDVVSVSFGLGNVGQASAPGDPTSHRAYAMTDHTALDDPHQGWFGTGEFSIDSGLIATMQTFVFAGAPKNTGGGVGHDLDDPRALYDVDTYTGVSADVEALWTLTSREVYAGSRALSDEAAAVVTPAVDAVDGVYNDAAPAVVVFALERYNAILVAADPVLALVDSIEPDAMKEPTDARDDFEGRATWGGHPFNGAYNSYSGYADSFHLWFDTIMYHDVCAGAYANAGAATVAEPLGCWDLTIAEPWAADTDPAGRETTYMSLAFASSAHLWYDANGDGYFNDACDATNPEEFDSERNQCNSPSIPEFRTPGEIVGVCDVSTAKGGTFTLTPVGGPWPGVLVVRDAEQTTRVLTDDHWEIREDSDPIVMRWVNTCTEDFQRVGGANLVGRDQLIFPNVFPDIGVLVRSEAVIDGFTDASRGIQVGEERVADYDYYPPAL